MAELGVICDKGHKITPKKPHHKTPLMVCFQQQNTLEMKGKHLE